MTCIVGIIEKKKVVIGGDSAGVGGLDVTIRKDTKVFKVGDFVIGCTSSFRMIQLLRFSLVLPKMFPNDDVYKYMCTEFINAVRNCFKSGGFAEKEREAEFGGTFLVGYKDRLFIVYNDYQVAEPIDGVAACGCGQSFALGALDAMNKKLPAEERIRKALEISTYRSGGVRPPFVIENT